MDRTKRRKVEPDYAVEEGRDAILCRRESYDGPTLDELKNRGVRSAAYPFQRAFLGFCEGNKRVLLADDMGLGKTFQVLCLVRMQPPPPRFFEGAVQARRFRGNTLVVVLKVTLEQWLTEYERHLEPLDPRIHRGIIYHGARAKGVSLADLCSCELVITTYDYIRMTARNEEGCPLLSVQWWRVVLDEGHYIKNPLSAKFRTIDQLEAARRVVMSGTPVHNGAGDVFPICRFLRLEEFAGAFEAAERYWKSMYETPLLCGDRADALRRIRRMLTPIVIRRSKTGTFRGARLVEGMPKKTFDTRYVPFDPEEDTLYAAIEESCKAKAQKVLKAAGDAIKGAEEAAFGKLHAMRLCCSVPQMCIDRSGRHAYVGSVCGACSSEQVSLYPCGCTLCRECVQDIEACPSCGKKLGKATPIEASTTHDDRAPSSKLKTLYALLCNLPAEDKAIVFSSWIMVLDSIERHIMRGPVLGTYARIDGSVSGNERRKQLEAFRSDPLCKVMLMTIGAGGAHRRTCCSPIFYCRGSINEPERKNGRQLGPYHTSPSRTTR